MVIRNKDMYMEQQEYKEMYDEACMESGEKPSVSGLKNFIEWRKSVEKFFDENYSE
jgi:hypothetical protein|tara:strand:+ start:225 stop:392 length:168 start_codon:yes stop_codon:yes gene_type:complete